MSCCQGPVIIEKIYSMVAESFSLNSKTAAIILLKGFSSFLTGSDRKS